MDSDYLAATGLPKGQGKLLCEAGFRRILRRATWTLLLGLTVPLLVALGLVEYMRRSANQVDQAYRVISEVNYAEKLLVTMQSSFRGYRLLSDPTLLASYNAARDKLEPRLDGLTDLVADNPFQQIQAEKFVQEAGAWMKVVEESLARLAAGHSAMSELPYLLAARKRIESAVAIADELIAEEERLLAERHAHLDGVVMVLVSLFGVFAAIGIPAMAIWLQGLLRKVSKSYRDSVARADLRATELEVTLNSIGDAVIAMDAQGLVTFVNPVAENLMGWTNSEAKGRPLHEVFTLLDEETGKAAPDPVARVLAENAVVGFSTRTVLRSRQGRECPIEDSAAPIRDKSGAVRGVILVFRDVRAKRETERLLEQSERRLGFLNELNEATRTLVEPAEIVTVVTQLLGQHLQVSRCVYAEMELDGEHCRIGEDYSEGSSSFVGEFRLELFGRSDAAELRAGRTLVWRNCEIEPGPEGRAAYRALGIGALVCRPHLKHGRLRSWLAVHQARPRIWTMAELGLIEDVVAHCWSTLERARAEVAVRVAKEEAEDAARKLAESADRFRLIAGVVSLQVWTAKLNGELDYVNQEGAHYFGGDVERDVLGNAWTQFVHPEDLPTALDKWLESVSSGQPYEVEFRLRDRKKNYRWFLARAVVTRDEQGRISKWFGTNTDIDAMKRAQSEAERASRAKDDFIAALSHELRTPLTPVLMTAASLRDDVRLPTEVREQLAMMERNISLEARLIDDLLDLTSISRGKFQLRALPVDAHALISLAIEIVRDDAQAKEMVIHRKFNAQRSGLVADPSRFQQVIWNLLRNAVKFTPQGGRITISTDEHRTADGKVWLRVSVADSGIGIRPDMLEKIFRPFDQGGLTGDHRFGGVGLGLAIARTVVNLHGGHITARSDGPGLGATFIAEFPGAKTPPHGISDSAQLTLPHMSSGTTPPIPPPASPVKRSLRLLLIEDHDATLQVLQRLLSREGHHVQTSRTVADALQIATTNQFDLVVSDLGLPDGTGMELMQKLRAAYGLRGIALSGYGMEDDLVRSREAGFIVHLIKPVDFQQLKQALDAFPGTAGQSAGH